jgi:hypothetical protein
MEGVISRQLEAAAAVVAANRLLAVAIPSSKRWKNREEDRG